MLSSSTSSSSSSSSRSISLSPESSCRKANRAAGQFGSRGEGTCRRGGAGRPRRWTLGHRLPCALCLTRPRAMGKAARTAAEPHSDPLRGAAARPARGFVPARAAALPALPDKGKPELRCLWETHAAFTSSSPLCWTVAAPSNSLRSAFALHRTAKTNSLTSAESLGYKPRRASSFKAIPIREESRRSGRE